MRNMKFRLQLPRDRAEITATVVRSRRTKKRPGPPPSVGGPRMNFLPGIKLRKQMDSLAAEALRDFDLKLNKSYILREGGYDQVRKLKILFQKARNGKLGPKQRKDIFTSLSHAA